MDSVKVLLTIPVGEEGERRIRAINPGIKLTNASTLIRAERKGDAAASEQLGAILADTEVMFGYVPRNYINRAPRLKWIQLISAGLNMTLDKETVEGPLIITNAKGVQSTSIAEFVFGLILMFVKESQATFQMKQAKQWARLSPAGLQGKTVGILGLGSIGQEIARLAKAFGMKVLGTRRSARRIGKAKNVDIIYPSSQLENLLSESDFVVIALPLTSETTKMIGERELKAMKSSAYLINIARGDIIDEEALIRALEAKTIAGAGLDVVTVEPLPADSRLWELPNVILSPHVAGSFEERPDQQLGVFLDNLKIYFDGKELVNQVDKRKGY